MKIKSQGKNSNLYIWLSSILKVGVFSAIGLIVIGLIMLFTSANLMAVLTVPMNKLVEEITNFNAAILITLGILVLLFTPIIQIILAIVKFAFDKEKLYLSVCLLLLCFLVISLLYFIF